MNRFAKHTHIILPALGGMIVAFAWMTPQASLAQWMQHPLRHDAAAAAITAANWARWGWTLGGLTLLCMPWILSDHRSSSAVPPRGGRALAAAILLAVVWRMLQARDGLWYDEIASLGTYVVHGPGVIMGNAFTTANHPLQSLLSWCMLPIGVEPWIRAPSILTGALAVLGAWWIGIATRPGTSLATWMAFCMALLPAAVNAASEARGYGLMIAASSLSTGLALMAMQFGGSWRWVLYAIVLALGVWSHFVTAMVGVGHVILALWMVRTPSQRVIAMRLLAAVACAAVLAMSLWSPLLPDLLQTRSQLITSRGDEPSWLGVQSSLLIWQSLGFSALPNHLGLGNISLALLAVPLLISGVIGCVQDRRTHTPLAAAGLGLPVALILVWLLGSWFYARFMLFSVPAISLIAGVGAANLCNANETNSRHRFRCLHWATILMAVTSWGILGCMWSRQPIREAVAFIAEHRTQNEVIVGIGLSDDVVQWYAMMNDLTIHPTGPNGIHTNHVMDRLHPHWIIQLYPSHTQPAFHSAMETTPLTTWTPKPFAGSIEDGDVVVYHRAVHP